MSEKINVTVDGGPAFPRPGIPTNWSEGHLAHEGMSLRDYFAGQALIGLLASPVAPSTDGVAITSHLAYAKSAYLWADSMLSAREAKQ